MSTDLLQQNTLSDAVLNDLDEVLKRTDLEQEFDMSAMMQKLTLIVDGDIKNLWYGVNSIPVLNPNAEKNLFQRLRNNPEDSQAKNIIIMHNLRLVVFVANKIKGMNTKCYLDFYDMCQEGFLGLVKAVDKFDPLRNFKFSTYAYYCIRSAIVLAIRSTGTMIIIPGYIHEKIGQLLTCYHEFMNTQLHKPTNRELAEAMKLTEVEVETLLGFTHYRASFSIEEIDEWFRFATLDMFEEANNPISILRESLCLVINQLKSEKQKKALIMRFGLEDDVCHTYVEIGKTMGIVRYAAQLLVQHGLTNLRKLLEKTENSDLLKIVRDYLDEEDVCLRDRLTA